MATLPSLHPRRLSPRHGVLIAALFGVALLLRADEALPVVARVPGILVLALLAVLVLVSGPRRKRS